MNSINLVKTKVVIVYRIVNVRYIVILVHILVTFSYIVSFNISWVKIPRRWGRWGPGPWGPQEPDEVLGMREVEVDLVYALVAISGLVSIIDLSSQFLYVCGKRRK